MFAASDEKRGQSAMEYMMVAGFISLVIIPTTFLFYTYASDSSEDIDRAQIDRFGRDVTTTAETVYYLGYPSRLVIEERLPKNVVSISTDRDTVTGTYLFSIAVESKGIVSNFTFPTNVRIIGNFESNAINPGQKKARIYAGPSIDGNTPFVSINFENSTCNNGEVNHNTCSATPPLFCFNGVLMDNCAECGGC
jgi:hypothetical protein